MPHTLIHALSACVALAGYNADAGLGEPTWQRPITSAVESAIERGDTDAKTFDACVAAVRNEIDKDAALGRWQRLENVENICEELGKELQEQQIKQLEKVC